MFAEILATIIIIVLIALVIAEVMVLLVRLPILIVTKVKEHREEKQRRIEEEEEEKRAEYEAEQQQAYDAEHANDLVSFCGVTMTYAEKQRHERRKPRLQNFVNILAKIISKAPNALKYKSNISWSTELIDVVGDYWNQQRPQVINYLTETFDNADISINLYNKDGSESARPKAEVDELCLLFTYQLIDGSIYFQLNPKCKKDIMSNPILVDKLLELHPELKEDVCKSAPKEKTFAQQERAKMTPKMRISVLERDHYTCCICGRNADDGVKLEVDHKIPIAKGGTTTESNLWTLCWDCNRGKSDSILKNI